jgi:hypothetical protein
MSELGTYHGASTIMRKNWKRYGKKGSWPTRDTSFVHKVPRLSLSKMPLEDEILDQSRNLWTKVVLTRHLAGGTKWKTNKALTILCMGSQPVYRVLR